MILYISSSPSAHTAPQKQRRQRKGRPDGQESGPPPDNRSTWGGRGDALRNRHRGPVVGGHETTISPPNALRVEEGALTAAPGPYVDRGDPQRLDRRHL